MKKPAEVMPLPTAEIFQLLQDNPLLATFSLIGGTGLSLHIGHRISEDLDFVTTTPKLPRAALQKLKESLQIANHCITPIVNPEGSDDFLNAGMDIQDYSQNWLIDNNVKITFFTADQHHKEILGKTGATSGFAVAPLLQIAQLKAIVACSRSKSRDWIDLFLLEKNHQFGVTQWREAYEKAGLTSLHFENALNRICSGKPQKGDEGFHMLLPNPPSIEEIAKHFQILRKTYEVTAAKEALTKKPIEKTDSPGSLG